jgi:hypothetical protein
MNYVEFCACIDFWFRTRHWANADATLFSPETAQHQLLQYPRGHISARQFAVATKFCTAATNITDPQYDTYCMSPCCCEEF